MDLYPGDKARGTPPAAVKVTAQEVTPLAGGRTLEFGPKGGLRVMMANGTAETYERVTFPPRASENPNVRGVRRNSPTDFSR